VSVGLGVCVFVASVCVCVNISVVCVCGVFLNLFVTQHAPLHSNITCFT